MDSTALRNQVSLDNLDKPHTLISEKPGISVSGCK